MAKRIMAGPPAPAPRSKSPSGTAPTITDGPSAADLLENRLEQLKSLLWCCYGEGIDWSGGDGPKHLGNVMWLAADMVDQAAELHQRCLSERAGPA
ncbi:hypothetical protein J2W23_001471 [Variovorax boronicumulans]|uniref:hypothetical protein n=1 Tax=Variovorax boronicumulans TaxID=436515 RepID=UPI0027809C6D|nr:hypothetical protein [Variovorax boronicumulans]MDQ0013092.1 hypothetical protein [Variovorax boronicumulans]